MPCKVVCKHFQTTLTWLWEVSVDKLWGKLSVVTLFSAHAPTSVTKQTLACVAVLHLQPNYGNKCSMQTLIDYTLYRYT